MAFGQRRRAGKKPTIDHTITAIPKELRGGYTGFWRASDVLEFTSHGYDGYVFDENNNRIDFKGYRADCITDLALEFFDQYDGQKPFFMTISTSSRIIRTTTSTTKVRSARRKNTRISKRLRIWPRWAAITKRNIRIIWARARRWIEIWAR